ncbi:MAG: T9SS type A sorting domain-containing protein [candidate division WOR-3 bacterium]
MHARFIALGLVFIFVAVPRVSANLLKNGDFSVWTSPAEPADWVVEDTTKARIGQSVDTVRSPSYAARITRLVAGTGNNKGLKQVVPVSAGHPYRLSVWYLDNDINAGGGITITWRDAGGVYIRSSSTVYCDSSIRTWQQLSVTDTAPTGAATADVLLRVYGFTGSPPGGVVYVDDAGFVDASGVGEGLGYVRWPSVRLAVRPNPSCGPTVIELELAHAGIAQLDVYDMTGSLAATAFRGRLGAGTHTVPWSGTDRWGRELPGGLYFVVLSDDAGRTTVSKLVLER